MNMILSKTDHISAAAVNLSRSSNSLNSASENLSAEIPEYLRETVKLRYNSFLDFLCILYFVLISYA